MLVTPRNGGSVEVGWWDTQANFIQKVKMAQVTNLHDSFSQDEAARFIPIGPSCIIHSYRMICMIPSHSTELHDSFPQIHAPSSDRGPFVNAIAT